MQQCCDTSACPSKSWQPHPGSYLQSFLGLLHTKTLITHEPRPAGHSMGNASQAAMLTRAYTVCCRPHRSLQTVAATSTASQGGDRYGKMVRLFRSICSCEHLESLSTRCFSGCKLQPGRPAFAWHRLWHTRCKCAAAFRRGTLLASWSHLRISGGLL